MAAGEKVLCAEAQRAVKQGGTAHKLSKRELEVLHCITQGLTNGQSGERFGISPKAVDCPQRLRLHLVKLR